MSTSTTRHHYPNALAALAALAILMSFTTGCSDKQESTASKSLSPATPAIVKKEQAPAPSTVTSEPAGSIADMEASGGNGERVYQQSCRICHDTGVANAPKLGDSDAWASRIAKGEGAMFESLKNGLNGMPPKGACMSCSDTELRAAMKYLASQGS